MSVEATRKRARSAGHSSHAAARPLKEGKWGTSEYPKRTERDQSFDVQHVLRLPKAEPTTQVGEKLSKGGSDTALNATGLNRPVSAARARSLGASAHCQALNEQNFRRLPYVTRQESGNRALDARAPDSHLARPERVAQPKLQELLKRQRWQRGRRLCKQLWIEGHVSQGGSEDLPTRVGRKRVSNSEFEWAGDAAEASVDFGHNLILSSEEKVEFRCRVEEELRKIVKVSHFAPSKSNLLFAETFERADVFDTWIASNSRTHPGQWKHVPRSPDAIRGDTGIMAASKGLRHAISSLLPFKTPPSPKLPMVLQYELQQQHRDFRCGGGYLTLFFSANTQELYQFDNETPYALQFGADQCGHRQEILLKATRMCSILGKRVEHSLYPSIVLPYTWHTRLLTLLLEPTGTYKILVDGRTIREGMIFEDLRPRWPTAQSLLQELPAELLHFNAVGMAFMSMDTGTLIDNIVLSSDTQAAHAFARETFWRRVEVEQAVSETALRARSALRKEIRARRQEAELLNHMHGSSSPDIVPTEFPVHTIPPAQATASTAERTLQRTVHFSSEAHVTATRVHSEALNSSNITDRESLTRNFRTLSWLVKENEAAVLNVLLAFSLILAL
ncbi:hypothetical protein Esti_006121 [Eimeria stiedai]